MSIHLRRERAGQRRARRRRSPSATRGRTSRSSPGGSSRIRWIITGTTISAVALILGDRLEGALRVELPAQHVGGAERQPDREVGESPRVEQRRGDHRRLARLERDHRQERRDRPERVGLAPLRTLRRACRARGEDDELARRARRASGPSRPARLRSATRGSGRRSPPPGPRRRSASARRRRPRAARRTPRRRSAPSAPSRSTTLDELWTGEHRVHEQRVARPASRPRAPRRRSRGDCEPSARPPSPSPHPLLGERPGEAVRAAVDLARTSAMPSSSMIIVSSG